MLRNSSQVLWRLSQITPLESLSAKELHSAATKSGQAKQGFRSPFSDKQKGKESAEKPRYEERVRKNYRDTGSPQSNFETPRTRYALRNRPDVTSDHDRPSRRPFGVIQQIQPLLNEGKLQDAIKMTKDAPLSSQNVVLWAILIQQAIKENKRELAWSLWNDMKKRGLSPSIRTFATFFSGFSHLVKDSRESLTEKQLERLASIWDQYQEHVTQLKAAGRNLNDPTVSYVSPYTSYFGILSTAGQHERVLELFSEMDSDGPFAPDCRVFTCVVTAISKRTVIQKGEAVISDPDVVRAENAQRIRALWNTIEAATERKNPKYRLEVDSFALVNVLHGLMKGNSVEDRELALQLIQRYIDPEIFEGIPHLQDSSLTNSSSQRPIQPTRYLLEIITELLSTMGPAYHSSCILFAQKIQSSPELRAIANRSTFEYALDACIHLSSTEASVSQTIPDNPSTPSQQALSILNWLVSESFRDPERASSHPLYPQRDTYNRVLLAAFRCKDLETAFQAFEIMTGYSRQQFQFSIKTNGQAEETKEIRSTKSFRNRIDPDAQSLSYLLRTARAVGKRGAEKTIYSIFEHYGGQHFFPPRRHGESEKHKSSYYEYVLAGTMQETLMDVLSEPMTKNQRDALRNVLEKMKGIKLDLKDAANGIDESAVRRRNVGGQKGRRMDRR